nr:MAG: ORF1 [TTV-like mini virus]UGV42436.1 MAG: ORF1 [TTV-like mini virus]
MPWYNYRPRRYRWRRRWRRPRGRFFRNYGRRRWVRRQKFKRKLTKIRLKQYQPKVIRKCTIRGPICLFQTTNERISNDFDLYEISEVPEHLPGGGGWGIKVYSLLSLYSEHEYARNAWTVTNTNLPLCRYLGCKLIFYQSKHVDYVVTVSNELPLHSSLGMYNAMQPSIHSMLPKKLIVPSRDTYKKKKPFFTIRVGPPTQLQNKWYFQQDLAKLPLLMTRTSAMSLQNFYISSSSINTNLTIISLNVSLFQNRNFKNIGTGYSPKTISGTKYYLYASRQYITSEGLDVKQLIPLLDTKTYSEGKSFSTAYPGQAWSSKAAEYLSKITDFYGNPFYPEYLSGTTPAYLIDKTPQQLFTPTTSDPPKVTKYATTTFTKTLRYNPYADLGRKNNVYFKSNSKEEYNWQPPDNPDLYNENLPFWIALWGFPDWHKKIKKHLHLDTDYILTMTQTPHALHTEYIVPLSATFLNGQSPYDHNTDNPPNPEDTQSWYPQLQYQTEIINKICMSGPGTVKLPPDFSVEALMRYKFYFKWGGSPAPMSQIEDPTEQIKYVIPSNELTTNSLQNPTGDPSTILWTFDQRRDYITPTAIRRLQKDSKTSKTFIADGSHFADYTPLQETQTQEESSEEEDPETLFQQLQQQRLKQRRLQQRIMNKLLQLQQSE